jgi:hypothetical protein
MARRFNWEKAKRRDRQRIAKLRTTSKKLKEKRRLKDTERQQHLQRFAEKYDITCFGSGPHSDRWATSGWSKRGAWIICVSCVARNRRKEGSPGNTGDRRIRQG